MPKIPPALALKFLDSHFTVKRTADSNEVRINSIYKTDNGQHLYINVAEGVFYDFKSNERGKIGKLFADFLDLPEKEVFLHLIREYSSKDTQAIVEEVVRDKASVQLPLGLRMFADVKEGIIRNRAYSYLSKRRIADEVINELGYVYDDNSEYNNRIFIPFYEDGEIVYFIARDFTGKSKLRYKNPAGLDTKEFVYNIDSVDDEVVICEGAIDAMSFDTKQTATAMLSAHIGRKQVTKILDKAPKRMILLPDNDETGDRTLERNIDLIYEYKPPSVRFELGVFHLPKNVKDFNELKMTTGKDFIDFNECEKRNKKKLAIVMPKNIIEV